MSPAPRLFNIDCKLQYKLSQTTDFIFQIHALEGADQHILDESLRLTPGAFYRIYEEPHAGQRFLRVQAKAGGFTLRYKAKVAVARPPRKRKAVELPIAELPDDVLHNLLPTRYCESDLLASAAHKLFGQLAPGCARVEAICDWIHENIDYRIGSTNSTSTACDAFLKHAGVCRDFAHLGITLCRALNIPARLAVGYAMFDTPPPDFHAMFEAYLGGRWELFDPTRMSNPRELVMIATGHDAKDVAFSTIFGQVETLAILPEVTRA
jgi:transglutaminase-like putative cysteine protease